jgi:hypothetical protein
MTNVSDRGSIAQPLPLAEVGDHAILIDETCTNYDRAVIVDNSVDDSNEMREGKQRQVDNQAPFRQIFKTYSASGNVLPA